MTDYYIGQVGIDPDKFWRYTWKENYLLGESWQINHNLEWERTRLLYSIVYNTNVSKKSDAKKPHQLIPLPQDNILKKGEPTSTRESFEAFRDKARKALKDKANF